MKNDNMERKFLKFKRHCKKQNYGVKDKKQMDILNFHLNKDKKLLKKIQI